MLQDIAPRQFKCEFKIEYPRLDDLVLYSENNSFLMKHGDKGYEFPTFQDTGIVSFFDEQGRFDNGKFKSAEAVYDYFGLRRTVGVDDTAFFTVESKRFFREDVEFSLVHKSKLRQYDPSYVYFGMVTAEQIQRWHKKHQYCGRCGNKTILSNTERAVICESCGEISYPQICPAVTISMIHDGKILLARNKNGTFRKYGQIAGYVEVGESFEEAVKREAFEETGLHVTNIQYYKNQPWALTDAHMIGFIAEVEGSTEVKLQESELRDARWFAPNEIPEDIADISLTYEMIGAFRKKYLKETDDDMSQQYRELFDLKGNKK